MGGGVPVKPNRTSILRGLFPMCHRFEAKPYCWGWVNHRNSFGAGACVVEPNQTIRMRWFGLEIDATVRALEVRPPFPPTKPPSSIFHNVFGMQALSDQNPTRSVRRWSAPPILLGAGFFNNHLPVQVARGKLKCPTVFFGLTDAKHSRTEGSGRNTRDVEVRRYAWDRVQMGQEYG